MVTTRITELRRALAFAETAREKLREGDLVDAGRYHRYAVDTAAFVRGLEAGSVIGDISNIRAITLAVDSTATLRRVLAEQGFKIDEAIRNANVRRRVDDASLVDLMAEGIRVLQTRDGVDVTDEQIIERARNQVTSLRGEYDVFER